MAIEDEIINISDIDVGTEILKSDKLLIETNNGTKLLAFKDLVIGEENITFKDKLVQGGPADVTGKSSTSYTTVSGLNILSDDTTAGHLTKYSDISGTIELGKLNYNIITDFKAYERDVSRHQSEIDTLKTQFGRIETVFSSSSALSSTQLSLSAVNWKGLCHTRRTNKIGFSSWVLDPRDTNKDMSADLDPLEIIYPDEDSGTYVASWVLFTGRLHWTRPDRASGYRIKTLTIYRNNESIWQSDNQSELQSISHVEYIKPGDVITVSMDGYETLRHSHLAAIKIS